MTAPFPTRKQEEWRYADLDALKPVWEQLAEPRRIVVAAGRKPREVWLPSGRRRAGPARQIALGEGAKARIFALNTARGLRPHRARRDARRRTRISSCSRPTSAAAFRPIEIVTNVRHVGERGRIAPDGPLGARRQGGRLLSRQGRGRARRAEDRRRAVGQGHAARPRRDGQLQARARDFRRRREMRARRDRRRARRDAIVLRRWPRARPGDARGRCCSKASSWACGTTRRIGDAICDAARDALRGRSHERRDPHQLARSTSAASSRRSRTGIISTAPRPRRSRRR